MEKSKLKLFNEWIKENYPKILRRLQARQEIDMDALHDAYLHVASGRSAKVNFLEVFLKEYNRFRTRNFNESFATSHPDELFFELLAGDLAEPETDNNKVSRESLAIKITKFIGAAFSAQENAIWSMRLKGFSIRDIAEAQAIPERRVKEVTLYITTRTQQQFANAI